MHPISNGLQLLRVERVTRPLGLAIRLIGLFAALALPHDTGRTPVTVDLAVVVCNPSNVQERTLLTTD